MRATIAQLEALTPVPFVLVLGIMGGILQSLVAVTQPRGAAALVLGLLTFAAEGLACWLGIRRRGYSVWSSAFQLTVASTLAQLVALPVALAVIFESPIPLAWQDVALEIASARLVMSLVVFVLALVVVAAGRSLGPGPGQSTDRATEARKHPDDVT